MTLDEYQKETVQFDVFPDKEYRITDVAFNEKILGLAGETGETLDKFKKIIRDKNGNISADDKREIAKELGDTLWYVSAIGRYLGLGLDEIAQINIDKLVKRKRENKIHGSGDNR